jgi:serine/threonine protein kinase
MNEESLFAAALEKDNAAERQAFLQDECGEDVALRRRLEQLLAAHKHACGILERGPDEAALKTDPHVTAIAAERVFAGRFKLREKLGEGGMGEVWVADQTQPVQRRVALKVIRSGLDSARVLARFEQERQALALMDHPNIAKVLDAGIDETGHPFFAMELIKGVPITKFCDEARLSTKQRLELFIPVCHAVQHAHHKGIIHRDIKPSNVIVCIYDGKPVPKVIDFGVAKATGPKLTEQTLYTEFGAIVGTFEYMSPEQAQLDQLDIDTRCDIYSLGVLLYELLTGTTPLERKRLKEVALLELLRLVREEEAPRLSTRLSTEEALPSIAANRCTEPKKLSRLMRGELDWIAMKTLEKDRNRRYETANGLAADLLRYLADEPVQACPPSTMYRLRKFAVKNRAALAIITTIMLVLVSGVAASTWQAVRAKWAEQKMGAALDESKEANAQKEKALSESEEARHQAQEVTKYLVELLRTPDPRQSGRTVKMADLLDRASAHLDANFTDSPKLKGELLAAVGKTYAGLRLYGKAADMFEKARTVRQTALGPDHRDTIDSMQDLAWAYRGAGRIDAAIALALETLTLQKATLGPEHRDTLATVAILGDSYRTAQRPADAIRLLEPSLKFCKTKLGSGDEITIRTMNNLALAYVSAGRETEAVSLFEETLEQINANPAYDPEDTLNITNNLGQAYIVAGRSAHAVPMLEESLKLCKSKLGPDHLTTVSTTCRLIDAYEATDQLAKIEPMLIESVASMRHEHGNEGAELAGALAMLGIYRLKQQKYADAELPIRECLAIRENQERDNWLTSNAKALLGGCLLGQQKFADAEPLLLAGYAGMKQHEAINPAVGKIRLTEALERLVQLYDACGKTDEADRWRKELDSGRGTPPNKLQPDLRSR